MYQFLSKCMQFLYSIIVSFVIASLIIIGVSSAFIYFRWYLKSDTNIADINSSTETVIY